MKKLLTYICTIIIGASIPIYFLVIWEPLSSEDVLSEDVVEESITNSSIEDLNTENKLETVALKKESSSNSVFNNLESDKREKLNSILKKLSIVDLIKVNDYFSDKNNNEKIKEGIELVKKRISVTEYEMFKNIIEDQVDSSIL